MKHLAQLMSFENTPCTVRIRVSRVGIMVRITASCGVTGVVNFSCSACHLFVLVKAGVKS